MIPRRLRLRLRLKDNRDQAAVKETVKTKAAPQEQNHASIQILTKEDEALNTARITKEGIGVGLYENSMKGGIKQVSTDQLVSCDRMQAR